MPRRRRAWHNAVQGQNRPTHRQSQTQVEISQRQSAHRHGLLSYLLTSRVLGVQWCMIVIFSFYAECHYIRVLFVRPLACLSGSCLLNFFSLGIIFIPPPTIVDAGIMFSGRSFCRRLTLISRCAYTVDGFHWNLAHVFKTWVQALLHRFRGSEVKITLRRPWKSCELDRSWTAESIRTRIHPNTKVVERTD